MLDYDLLSFFNLLILPHVKLKSGLHSGKIMVEISESWISNNLWLVSLIHGGFNTLPLWGCYSFLPTRFSLLAGCMLCFGQSAFFRFNHPEEALRMKSMLPGGLSTPRTHPTGKDNFFYTPDWTLLLIQLKKGYSNRLVSDNCVYELSYSEQHKCFGLIDIYSHLGSYYLCVKIKMLWDADADSLYIKVIFSCQK